MNTLEAAQMPVNLVLHEINMEIMSTRELILRLVHFIPTQLR